MTIRKQKAKVTKEFIWLRVILIECEENEVLVLGTITFFDIQLTACQFQGTLVSAIHELVGSNCIAFFFQCLGFFAWLLCNSFQTEFYILLNVTGESNSNKVSQRISFPVLLKKIHFLPTFITLWTGGRFT